MTTPSPTQVVSIKDFTPGIVRFSRGSYGSTSTPRAPLGSASSAFRCYAVQGVGLVPFPAYQQFIGGNLIASPNGSYIMTCGLKTAVLLYPFNEEALCLTLMDYDGTNTNFSLNQSVATGPSLSALSVLFTSSVAGSALAPQTPNMVRAYLRGAPQAVGNCIITVDPITYPVNASLFQNYVIWDQLVGGGGPISYTYTAPANFLDIGKLAVQSERLVYISVNVGTNVQTIWGIQDPPQGVNTINDLNQYEPSQILSVGSWGSIDAGEFFVVGSAGGGLYISGDIFAPSSVIKLPGVASTGCVIGPGALSPAGYIYPTETGAYVWNGGNTSQKVSNQIPDDVLYRTNGFTFPNPHQRPCLTHHDVWGDWVMFANNWFFDTITSSWWQTENPAINNISIHTYSLLSPRFFYSSSDYIGNQSGGALGITQYLYAWDRNVPSTSYVWVSNPIETSPGYLNTLQEVEICASNPTSTTATIVITPQPAPFSPTPNPIPGNNTQSVTFTIQPYTSSYRASKSLGYTDYNVQVAVNAANSGSGQAPILHELNIWYSNATTSSTT